jgi:hypothetical protein
VSFSNGKREVFPPERRRKEEIIKGLFKKKAPPRIRFDVKDYRS